MMLIWLAAMIAWRGETYLDDVLMILAGIASWIIWLVSLLAEIEFSTIIPKCISTEECMVYFSFLSDSDQNLCGFLDILNILSGALLDDVIHAVKVLQGWSKFSKFNLFKKINVFRELREHAERACCFPTTYCFIHIYTVICIHTWESCSKTAAHEHLTLSSCNAASGGSRPFNRPHHRLGLGLGLGLEGSVSSILTTILHCFYTYVVRSFFNNPILFLLFFLPIWLEPLVTQAEISD